jgi:hypothetical protein
MALHPIDGYLLDGRPAKAEVADEALMALRLALAGRTIDDDAVRNLRTLVAAARTGDASARDAYLAALGTP